MRPEGKGYILKEYGSWSVLTVAYAIGLGVSKEFPWQAIPLYVALGLLVNAKQSYTQWVRTPGYRRPSVAFLGQVSVAAVTLLLLFGSSFTQLLPLLIFPAAYLLMNRYSGEHHVLTELLGFALLSLAAVLARFLVVQGVDVRLFVATSLYFTAGVFKVKAVLLKRMRDRILAVLHIAFALYIYGRFQVAWIILLPLVENIVMAITLYKVKLKTTGWIEVAKSLLFLVLLLYFF